MQTQTSSAQRLTAAALTGLIAQGQGRISSIYLHWTAGRYGQLFADYHFNIDGDGSFQMQFMELATMIQHNIAVKVIVMTNNRLGMVRELQTNGYDNRLTAVFLDGSPDFIKLADSYGIPAKRITDIADADKAIDEMLSSKGCYLLEVRVAENEKTIL